MKYFNNIGTAGAAAFMVLLVTFKRMTKIKEGIARFIITVMILAGIVKENKKEMLTKLLIWVFITAFAYLFLRAAYTAGTLLYLLLC